MFLSVQRLSVLNSHSVMELTTIVVGTWNLTAITEKTTEIVEHSLTASIGDRGRV